MLIGFTDDSLAGIIANILADIANVWDDWILNIKLIDFLKNLLYNKGLSEWFRIRYNYK